MDGLNQTFESAPALGRSVAPAWLKSFVLGASIYRNSQKTSLYVGV
ncbi:hypothetical protein LPW11_18195 [Geomonas sp. RF6]|nr:hypothetical protein [Geomonas sp. RF6]UFS69807.1 hypothetical protein LPW11_18195 [Geomonas sp. RF6]